jgi:hypothetical protein
MFGRLIAKLGGETDALEASMDCVPAPLVDARVLILQPS